MNSALLVAHKIWHSLHGTRTPLAPRTPKSSEATDAVRRHRATAALPPVPCHRPLRVVRIMESGQPATQVGRMFISGRMADVCAELDRLAARESLVN